MSLGVLVARSLGPQEFGRFSLVLGAAMLVLGASQAFSTDPLLVRYSGAELAKWKRAARSSVGSAAALGATSGLVFCAVGAGLGDPLGPTLVAFGATLPGVLVQDAWRHIFFARRRGGMAFLNDMVWFVTLLVAVSMIHAWGLHSAQSFAAAWGGAACVAAIVGYIQLRVVPRPFAILLWAREQRDLAPAYLGEFAVTGGANQLVLYSVGAAAGFAAVGALRAGLILLGPLNILFMGVRLVAVPEGARIAPQPERLRRMIIYVSASLGLVAAAWMTALLMMPHEAGEYLLQDTWGPAHPLLAPLGLSMVGAGIAAGASTGVRVLEAARLGFRARAAQGVLTVGGAVGGAAAAGSIGAAWGIAAARWLAATVWWVYVVRALKVKVHAAAAGITVAERRPS